MFNGNLTRGLLDGLVGSFWSYQYRDHTHGPTVYGLLLWPFFLIGGSRYLWIKVIGAGFAAGGVYFWTTAVRRAWGLAAAVSFLLLCTAAPPLITEELHYAYANHMESLFFMGVMAGVVRALDRRRIPRPENCGHRLCRGICMFFFAPTA